MNKRSISRIIYTKNTEMTNMAVMKVQMIHRIYYFPCIADILEPENGLLVFPGGHLPRVNWEIA